MKALAVVAVLTALPVTAHADELDGTGTVIFTRGTSLYRTDPRGKGETEIATLPAKVAVRALRTDARGTVLLADLAGSWSWMKLDGSASSLSPLPCADGPAQLAVDGACVLCRSTTNPSGSVIVNLATGKQVPIPVPPPGARLIGLHAGRRLVWADATGVWSSPPGNPKAKQQVAPEAPLRSFLPSPDGKRATGVYLDKVFEGRTSKPAEVFTTFALDGQGARRKLIKTGVPIEWSHDGAWLLVQDGGSACIISATGGQYKCWKGYTGASVSPDGRYALLLGDRASASDGDKSKKSSKKKGDKKSDKKKKPASRDADDDEDAPEPTGEAETAGGDMGSHGDDVEVPLPTGPLALYRAKLEGAFTDRPARIISVIDGAAVWVPPSP